MCSRDTKLSVADVAHEACFKVTTHISLPNAWRRFRHEMQTCALGIGTLEAIRGAAIHQLLMAGFAAEIKLCLGAFTVIFLFIRP